MNKSELLAEIERLKAEVEKMQDDEPKFWLADGGYNYWVVGSDLLTFIKVECRSTFDSKLFEIGNYFKTKEEAEKEARHRKFEMKVARRIKELNGSEYWFKRKKQNFTIEIDVDDELVSFHYRCAYVQGQRGWWSDKREVIEKVIEEFGADNFIKWAKGDL